MTLSVIVALVLVGVVSIFLIHKNKIFIKKELKYYNNFLPKFYIFEKKMFKLSFYSNILSVLSLKISNFFSNWVLSTNHRRIAIMYFLFTIISGFTGLVLATVIRIELAYPGQSILVNNAEKYLTIISLHGIIMVFFMIIPIIFGAFGNFLLPTQLGIRDVAFPRLNSFMFWITPSGFVMLLHIILFDKSYNLTYWINYSELKFQLRRRYFLSKEQFFQYRQDSDDSLLALRFKKLNNSYDVRDYLLYDSATDVNSNVSVKLNFKTSISGLSNKVFLTLNSYFDSLNFNFAVVWCFTSLVPFSNIFIFLNNSILPFILLNISGLGHFLIESVVRVGLLSINFFYLAAVCYEMVKLYVFNFFCTYLNFVFYSIDYLGSAHVAYFIISSNVEVLLVSAVNFYTDVLESFYWCTLITKLSGLVIVFIFFKNQNTDLQNFLHLDFIETKGAILANLYMFTSTFVVTFSSGIYYEHMFLFFCRSSLSFFLIADQFALVITSSCLSFVELIVCQSIGGFSRQIFFFKTSESRLFFVLSLNLQSLYVRVSYLVITLSTDLCGLCYFSNEDVAEFFEVNAACLGYFYNRFIFFIGMLAYFLCVTFIYTNLYVIYLYRGASTLCCMFNKIIYDFEYVLFFFLCNFSINASTLDLYSLALVFFKDPLILLTSNVFYLYCVFADFLYLFTSEIRYLPGAAQSVLLLSFDHFFFLLSDCAALLTITLALLSTSINNSYAHNSYFVSIGNFSFFNNISFVTNDSLDIFYYSDSLLNVSWLDNRFINNFFYHNVLVGEAPSTNELAFLYNNLYLLNNQYVQYFTNVVNFKNSSSSKNLFKPKVGMYPTQYSFYSILKNCYVYGFDCVLDYAYTLFGGALSSFSLFWAWSLFFLQWSIEKKLVYLSAYDFSFLMFRAAGNFFVAEHLIFVSLVIKKVISQIGIFCKELMLDVTLTFNFLVMLNFLYARSVESVLSVCNNFSWSFFLIFFNTVGLFFWSWCCFFHSFSITLYLSLSSTCNFFFNLLHHTLYSVYIVSALVNVPTCDSRVCAQLIVLFVYNMFCKVCVHLFYCLHLYNFNNFYFFEWFSSSVAVDIQTLHPLLFNNVNMQLSRFSFSSTAYLFNYYCSREYILNLSVFDDFRGLLIADSVRSYYSIFSFLIAVDNLSLALSNFKLCITHFSSTNFLNSLESSSNSLFYSLSNNRVNDMLFPWAVSDCNFAHTLNVRLYHNFDILSYASVFYSVDNLFGNRDGCTISGVSVFNENFINSLFWNVNVLNFEVVGGTFNVSKVDEFFYNSVLSKNFCSISGNVQKNYSISLKNLQLFSNFYVKLLLNMDYFLDWKELRLEREIWRSVDDLSLARRHWLLRKKYYANFYEPETLINKVSIWFPNHLIPGWAFVTPYSSRLRYTALGKVDIALVVILMASVGSTFSSINYVITYRYIGSPIFKNRKELRSFFIDALLVSSRMMILANPALIIGIILLLSDRHFGTSVFDFSGGGDTILFQHLFWFFGHPEVYIIIIPCFGFMNSLLPYYLKKRLSGRLSLQFSIYTIAFMGFAVWGHHMYMVGLANSVRTLYSTMTIMISVPASTKVLHWCVTIINSTISCDVGFLFLLSFMYFFVLGGLSGMFLAHIGFDVIFHDTFYVIGHFHVLLAGAAMSCVFAAFYFYFPAIFGVKYSRVYAYLHFFFYTSGQLLTLVPMFWLGYAGMPRRIMDYPSIFGGWHSIISSGHILTFLSLVFFLLMIFDSLYESRSPISKTKGISRLNTRLSLYVYETRKLKFYKNKILYNKNNYTSGNKLCNKNLSRLELLNFEYVFKL